MPNHCLIPMLCGIDFSSWEEVHEWKGQNVIILRCCVILLGSTAPAAWFRHTFRKVSEKSSRAKTVHSDCNWPVQERSTSANCYSYWLEFKIILLKVIYRTRFWFFFFFFPCNLCCPSKFSLKWTYCLSRFVCLSVKQVCF